MDSLDRGSVAADAASQAEAAVPYQQVVVCAAVRYPDGRMLVGPRHFDATMHTQFHAFGIKTQEDRSVQGFIDQHGAFLTREEAWKIAEANGQIKKRVGGDTINGGRLFSENLY